MSATKSKPRTRPAAGRAPRAERAEKLSEDVFQEVEAGQRAAIKAVKQFVDTVDRTLPPQADGPSKRQTVVDAAMEMADQLVHVQYDFLRKVVRSTGKSLGR